MNLNDFLSTKNPLALRRILKDEQLILLLYQAINQRSNSFSYKERLYLLFLELSILIAGLKRKKYSLDLEKHIAKIEEINPLQYQEQRKKEWKEIEEKVEINKKKVPLAFLVISLYIIVSEYVERSATFIHIETTSFSLTFTLADVVFLFVASSYLLVTRGYARWLVALVPVVHLVVVIF